MLIYSNKIFAFLLKYPLSGCVAVVARVTLVAKAHASPRISTWFTRPFFPIRRCMESGHETKLIALNQAFPFQILSHRVGEKLSMFLRQNP